MQRSKHLAEKNKKIKTKRRQLIASPPAAPETKAELEAKVGAFIYYYDYI